MPLIDFGPRWPLLRTTLSAAVPLRMAELRNSDPHDLIAWMERNWPIEKRQESDSDNPADADRVAAWNARPNHRSPWITDADVLTYGRGQRVIAATAQLTTGLAIIALTTPGGVDFGDLHFCSNHSECMGVAA